MKHVSTSTHERHGLRHRAVRVGPVTYFSMRSQAALGRDPARFIFCGRWSVSRGALDGLLEGLDEAARFRIVRRQHPSVVLALSPAEPTDDWPDGDPNA